MGDTPLGDKWAGGADGFKSVSPTTPKPTVVPSPALGGAPCSGHLAFPRMKYWSCCRVETMDFSTFLEQLGCSNGRHCWTQKGVRGLMAGVTRMSKVPLSAPEKCSFPCSAFTQVSAFNSL